MVRQNSICSASASLHGSKSRSPNCRQSRFRSVAQQILNSFLHWIAAGLRVENEEQRAPLAALMLALIEGFVLFDTLGADATRALALAGVALIPRR